MDLRGIGRAAGMVAAVMGAVCLAYAAPAAGSFGAMDNIMDFVVGMAVIIAGFGLIYLIANIVGRDKKDTDKIAPEPESAKERLESNDSEKPLRPVMITAPILLNLFWIFCAILVIYETWGAIDEISRGVFVWNEENVKLVLILITLPLLVSLSNTIYIFGDDGITVKFRVYLLFFAVYKESTLIPWIKINNVTYEKSYTGKLHIKEFMFISVKRSITLSFLHTGYRDGLECAVNKLPKYKFTAPAREKLKKMGIWGDDIY